MKYFMIWNPFSFFAYRLLTKIIVKKPDNKPKKGV